jgi:hypothetical protein
MRSLCSCRRTSGSRVSGKRLLRLFPQLKRALVLRQAKLGVTRGVRPQKINALGDHCNSVGVAISGELGSTGDVAY